VLSRVYLLLEGIDGCAPTVRMRAGHERSFSRGHLIVMSFQVLVCITWRLRPAG
jgi:hypothetical protein